MDGSNVAAFGDTGTVNCQFYPPGMVPVPEIGNLEAFELIPIPNRGYAIRSVNFPNSFLFLSGIDMTGWEGAGGGVVQCQFDAPPEAYPLDPPTFPVFPAALLVFELLDVESTDGMENIQSLQSIVTPQVFLRIDGSGVNQFSDEGSGTVNCQWYPQGVVPNTPGYWEALNIVYL
jgi:phospholipase C